MQWIKVEPQFGGGITAMGEAGQYAIRKERNGDQVVYFQPDESNKWQLLGIFGLREDAVDRAEDHDGEMKHREG